MRRVKVSIAQQNHLINFMKAHPEFAKARTCSLQHKIDYERQWQQLARALNNLGGPIKSVDKWKQVNISTFLKLFHSFVHLITIFILNDY